MFIVNLPQEYGYVLLSCVILAVEIIFMGFFILNRSSVFNEKFMKQKFGDIHQKQIGQQLAKAGGYPDMGNGWYSRELSYKQWYEFNNRQRAHQNFVQWIASNILLILVGGIYFPIVCASLGLAVAIFRIIYAIGYVVGGAFHPIRSIGAIANDLLTLASIVFAVWSSIKWISGNLIN